MPASELLNHYPLIAAEGRTAVAITAVLGVGLYLAFDWIGAAPAIAALVFLLFFFRDPSREMVSLPLGVVSPVNGRVVRLEAGYDPWLGREAVLVTVKMGLFDVHSLFSPMEGKIIEQWSLPKHAVEGTVPRRAIAYQIRTDEGDDIVFEIARGQLGGSLKIYYQPGERIGHGRRIGFARMGCLVTTYAARASRLDCGLGDDVVAGKTMILSLVHNDPVSAIEPAADTSSST